MDVVVSGHSPKGGHDDEVIAHPHDISEGRNGRHPHLTDEHTKDER